MWLVDVVSRRWVWLVVRRYIDILTIIINFSYSTCISSFFGSSIPTSFIFKMLYIYIYIYIFQAVRRARAINAQTYVGLAG